jgi:hypothetical protein
LKESQIKAEHFQAILVALQRIHNIQKKKRGRRERKRRREKGEVSERRGSTVEGERLREKKVPVAGDRY